MGVLRRRRLAKPRRCSVTGKYTCGRSPGMLGGRCTVTVGKDDGAEAPASDVAASFFGVANSSAICGAMWKGRRFLRPFHN